MFRFDFALSFSGSDRSFARNIRSALKDSGFSVFYDEDYEHEMLGQDGSVYLRNIYGTASRYCIVLISESYEESNWTNLERESIQARELKGERGRLIPIKLDDYEPNWLPATRIYFDLRNRPLIDLVTLLTRIIAADNADINRKHEKNLESFEAKLVGVWSIVEQLSNQHVRRGSMVLQQTQNEVYGSANLVEEYFDREVMAEFSIHGHVEPVKQTVRLTLALEDTVSHTGSLSTKYSVDILVGSFSNMDKIEGKCTDQRGMSSVFTMIRK